MFFPAVCCFLSTLAHSPEHSTNNIVVNMKRCNQPSDAWKSFLWSCLAKVQASSVFYNCTRWNRCHVIWPTLYWAPRYHTCLQLAILLICLLEFQFSLEYNLNLGFANGKFSSEPSLTLSHFWFFDNFDLIQDEFGPQSFSTLHFQIKSNSLQKSLLYPYWLYWFIRISLRAKNVKVWS